MINKIKLKQLTFGFLLPGVFCLINIFFFFHPVYQRSNFPGFLYFIPNLNLNRFFRKVLESATTFPGFSSTKSGLQVFILSSSFSVSSIYIPDWLNSFFVLAGYERALVEVAGGLPDWLEFFRGKRAEWVWDLEFKCETLGDTGHVGSQKCTLWRSCLLRQAQMLLIWVVLRETFHRNANGIFAGACAGAKHPEDQFILTLSLRTLTQNSMLSVGYSLI